MERYRDSARPSAMTPIRSPGGPVAARRESSNWPWPRSTAPSRTTPSTGPAAASSTNSNSRSCSRCAIRSTTPKPEPESDVPGGAEAGRAPRDRCPLLNAAVALLRPRSRLAGAPASSSRRETIDRMLEKHAGHPSCRPPRRPRRALPQRPRPPARPHLPPPGPGPLPPGAGPRHARLSPQVPRRRAGHLAPQLLRHHHLPRRDRCGPTRPRHPPPQRRADLLHQPAHRPALPHRRWQVAHRLGTPRALPAPATRPPAQRLPLPAPTRAHGRLRPRRMEALLPLYR